MSNISFKNMPVLIADDSEFMCRGLKVMLEKIGFSDIEFAFNGKEAIAALNKRKKTKKQFALFFCDIVMPVLNGFDTLKHCKSDADLQNIPFIVISAEKENKTIIEMLQNGSADYITKPFDYEKVEKKIHNILQDAETNAKRVLEQQIELTYAQEPNVESARENNLDKLRLDAFVKSLPFSAWVTEDGKTIQLNNYFAAQYNLELESIVDKDFVKDIFSNPTGEVRKEIEVNIFESNHHFLLIGRVYNSNSKPEKKEALIIGLLIDDLIQTRRKLLDQQQLMVNSAKLASLGEMAGGVAHEINNPLTIILGKVEMIAELFENNKIDKQEVKEHFKSITNNVDRIAKIIHALLSFSRSDSQPIQKNQPIKQILDNIVQLSQERISRENVQLQINPFPENLQIYGNSTKIEEVFLNLISNALDAVKNLEEKWINISVLDIDECIEIQIVDSGKGLSEEVQKKIFEPFFTTKGIGNGTGLGLSLSKGIIEEMGGNIYIDNSSKNTRFCVSFPRLMESNKKVAA